MIAFLLAALSATGSASAIPTRLSPEEEARKIANQLRPISDEQWQSIAGPQAQQTYSVVRGDTLWGVSKRLFGDPKYWPKIWGPQQSRYIERTPDPARRFRHFRAGLGKCTSFRASCLCRRHDGQRGH